MIFLTSFSLCLAASPEPDLDFSSEIPVGTATRPITVEMAKAALWFEKNYWVQKDLAGRYAELLTEYQAVVQDGFAEVRERVDGLVQSTDAYAEAASSSGNTILVGLGGVGLGIVIAAILVIVL